MMGVLVLFLLNVATKLAGRKEDREGRECSQLRLLTTICACVLVVLPV